jgi:hypothetical protein
MMLVEDGSGFEHCQHYRQRRMVDQGQGIAS